jgi:hypothetical protein
VAAFLARSDRLARLASGTLGELFLRPSVTPELKEQNGPTQTQVEHVKDHHWPTANQGPIAQPEYERPRDDQVHFRSQAAG